MKTSPVRLVTIVAESVLAQRLIEELRRLGAAGYTLSECSGEGPRGVRSERTEGDNVRIETLVPAAVAERLLAQLGEAYLPFYALVAWSTDAQMLGAERYA